MIPIDLRWRNALMTGDDSGLGAATAKSLAQAGADIVIAYRDGPQAAKEVAATAKMFDVKLAIVRLADGANRADLAARFQRIDQKFDGIDILANNASTDGHRAPCLESDPAGFSA
jgi:NAD(P)-dependent dehydrogenase (short-subunit alcohol dehydrogenase family)